MVSVCIQTTHRPSPNIVTSQRALNCSSLWEMAALCVAMTVLLSPPGIYIRDHYITCTTYRSVEVHRLSISRVDLCDVHCIPCTYRAFT